MSRPTFGVMTALLCLSFLCTAVADVTVDFDYLTQLNDDCIGWLYQPESGLNQPVMQHETNDWYHERAFDETKIYKTGSIYLNAADQLNTKLTVLHGQAREEGCLSVLPDWCDQTVFDTRAPFRLLTPDGSFLAEAFACMLIEEAELDTWLQESWVFESWLRGVQTTSLVKADPARLPSEDDRLLLLAGHHLNGKITLLFTKLLPAAQTEGSKTDLTKLAMDERDTLNRLVDAGPAGQMVYYAQNDPLYQTLYYESGIRSGTQRNFGGGGCGPTAMAIIAANLVDMSQLPRLGTFALHPLGNLFCSCAVNRVFCDHTHVPYRLQTPEEYLRYLPVAMGDFAAGNNTWEYVARRVDAQGTNIRFVDYVCEVYGLNQTPVSGLDEALELMKEKTGEGLILTSALRGSPYTANSHFVIITGVDEEYFYILDPLRRTEEEYAKIDTRHVLEWLSPGVTRIRLADRARTDLSPVCYISP